MFQTLIQLRRSVFEGLGRNVRNDFTVGPELELRSFAEYFVSKTFLKNFTV